MTPQARSIHALFNARDEHVINDHVAFRTFDVKRFDLDRASELLATIGYEAFDHYTFSRSSTCEPKPIVIPDDSNAPKIFFSELIRSELDEDTQAIIRQITKGLKGALTLTDLTGRYPFDKPTSDQYQTLANVNANTQVGCQRWGIKPITSQSM